MKTDQFFVLLGSVFIAPTLPTWMQRAMGVVHLVLGTAIGLYRLF